MPGRAQGAAISEHLVIRTARGRLILGRTASFPAAVQRVADLGQRPALAMLARDDGALARIRTWPGRSDLGSNIRGLDDHQLMQVVRRAVANSRLLVLAMDDAVATVTVPPPPTGRPAAAKPPPGMTLTPAQEKDAAIAAMDMMDKVTAALQRSAKYMGPELANAFLQLFTLDNLKVMAAFIIAGALANTNPLSAAVFDSAMLIMVFYLAGSAGIEALGLLVTTTLSVIDAKSDADLDRAGEQYAKAFVGLGGAVFMAWLARRIIKEKNTGGGGGQGSRASAAPEPARPTTRSARNDRYLNDRAEAPKPVTPPTKPAAPEGNLRSRYMGRTPDKFSRTGSDVVDRMRQEGKIVGDGPLLRGNPNNLQLVGKDGKLLPIDGRVDMAHKTDAVTWWNETGRFYGPKSPEVRKFMLNPANYMLQESSINRSAGALLGETYKPPVPPTFSTLKR